MTTTSPSPIDVCRYLEEELDESFEDTLKLQKQRLFAIHTRDNQMVHELAFEHGDPYEILMNQPVVLDAEAFALVMTGWMSKIADGDEEIDMDDEERIRVRIITAVNDQGVSCLVRQYENKDEPMSFEDGGEGMFPDALKVYWSAYKSLLTNG